MKVTGIVAEFNPLHNGHEYLISTAKKNSDAVVCVLSSDFVQRGDCAVINKKTRAHCALLCGADLIIELPTVWSMSGAESFALGAVSLLKNTGIVNNIAFGVKNNNLELLNKIAEYLLNDDFFETLKNEMQNGCGFAVAREKILKDKFNIDDDFLKDGNNILAAEYIKACKKLSFITDITPLTRVGALHDSKYSQNSFCSSTYLREIIKNGNIEDIEPFVPKQIFEIYKTSSFSNINNISNAILFKLRELSTDDLKGLNDISEGLENRLFKAIKTAANFDQLIENLKTKRYPTARVRRLALSAALDIKCDGKTLPPYIRILGFNDLGKQLLKDIYKKGSLPLIVNSKQAFNLNENAKRVFEEQCRITDLYNLSFDTPANCGSDITYMPIKI